MNSNPSQANRKLGVPLPKLWGKFSVRTGTLLQLAGIVAGALVLYVSARLHSVAGPRIGLLILGWFTVYVSSHAIAHVAVGRAVGIRFRAYGVRGTDHPENYPPVVRQLMSIVPMWSAITHKASLRNASPRAKAAMFAAGETSTTVASIAAAAYAAWAGIPGGHNLLVISIVWAVASTVTVSIVAKGDYTKALRALGWRKPAAEKSATAAPDVSAGRREAGAR